MAVAPPRQEVKASSKYVRTSPRKARLVVEHIRGRSVPEARTVLAFTPRAVARDIEKLLKAAVANAEANHGLIGDDLLVSAAYVDEGPVFKRWRARARGRAARIRKRTCHITLKLSPTEDVAVARANARGQGRGEAEALAAPQGGAAEGGEEGRRAEGRSQGQAQADHDQKDHDAQEERERQLMGQKVHPGGMRVGVIHDWKSNWYTGNKEFAAAILEDVKIREHIYGKLAHAGLSDILIRKDKQRITIDIYTARPGIVIGKSGSEVDALRKEIHGMTSKNVHININEIKRPELDAKLVAQSIAEQLQNRVSFRRAMKRSLASAIRSGAHGVKVQCGGRLGGTEMSRSESYSEGRVPLHTIRADIDYGFVEAKTTYGRIGVKVWINKGEIMPEGYESVATQKETRLGDQDTARRRGGRKEGLSASRESGRRGGAADREGLGPVQKRRPRRGAQPRKAAPKRDSVEPRADAQPEVKPEVEETTAPVAEVAVEETPPPVAEAPDTTAPVERPRSRRSQGEDPAPWLRRPTRRRRSKSREAEEEGQGEELSAAPKENEVPQAAARPPPGRLERTDARCSSATTGSRRWRQPGSRTASSRPPVSP